MLCAIFPEFPYRIKLQVSFVEAVSPRHSLLVASLSLIHFLHFPNIILWTSQINEFHSILALGSASGRTQIKTTSYFIFASQLKQFSSLGIVIR